MQISLKTVVAAVGLALASSAAFGQAAPPAGPVPNANLGDGGLLFSAWDGTRSVVQWIGPTYLTSEISDLTGTSPINLSYTISNFNAFFPDTSAVQYAVFAADNARAGFQGAGLSTTVANPDVVTEDNFISFFFAEVVNITQRIADFGQNAINGGLGCNGTNPCFATSNAAFTYSGEGGSLQGANPEGTPWTIGAAVGSALAFYNFQTTVGSDGVTYSRYAANGTNGQWLLGSDGILTYSFAPGGAPVPLPAALWMLLSGLGGLGVIARRKLASV